MATNIERSTQMCAAILNKQPTAQQQGTAARAIAINQGRVAEYDAATNEQRAGFLVASVRAWILQQIKQAEQAGQQDAMHAALTAAVQQIDADFAEAP